MSMSYRSAWLLVDSMNAQFKKPVVSTTLGGQGGGSATLTDFGASVIRRYRTMERATRRAIAKDLGGSPSDISARRHDEPAGKHPALGTDAPVSRERGPALYSL